MRTRLGPAFAALLVLAACGRTPPDTAAAATPATAPSAAASSRTVCGLLTLDEVRRVVPDAVAAAPRNHLASDGIDVCSWKDASGKRSVVEVSVWRISGADDTPLENARTLAMGLADPLRSGADTAVRLETIAGIGEGGAVAFVERMDAARGIIGTGAMLVLQKNGRIATVQSSALAARERAAALDGLKTLGRTVAGRL